MNLYIKIILGLHLLAQHTQQQDACIACCLKGASGPPGRIGLIGPAGEAGLPAPHGRPGFFGPHGAKGDQGFVGDIGVIGEKGERGLRGDEGPQGSWDGDNGDLGEEGDQGDEGIKGNKGPSSSKGTIGTNGISGDGGRKRVSDPSSFYAAYSGEDFKSNENAMLPFRAVITNDGNDFNANGKYTAPVAGTYFFSVTIGKAAENTDKLISIQQLSADGRTNTTKASNVIGPGNNEVDSLNLSLILHLNANEQVYVQVYKNTVIEGDQNVIVNQHTFSGYLIMDD